MNKIYYTNKVIVLMYHFIVQEEKSPSTREISPERFASHLESLKNAGYSVISIGKYFRFVKNNEAIPANSVVITFDDGHDSFYKYAYPLLCKYGFPATNFIKVKLADSSDPSKVRHLTWEQMREMKQKGMSFYSHTFDHHRMAGVGGDGRNKGALVTRVYLESENRLETQEEYLTRIKSDLQLADQRIREELGNQPKLLCFPYGQYNDSVVEVGKDLGIELFFTIHEGINDQKQTLVYRINSGATSVSGEGLLDKMKQSHTKLSLSTSDRIQSKILLCYGKTPYTPGRYLEDAMRAIGVGVDVYTQEIDFNQIDVSRYLGVLFVESVERRPVQAKNIGNAKIPKLFWIHHADNRLSENYALAKQYKPDIMLMSHSLQLAKHFPAPVRFFPFAMDRTFFNCSIPLCRRELDLAFVGNNNAKQYPSRNENLKAIEFYFQKQYKLSLHSKVFLRDLGKLYGNSKIVFNQTADYLKTFNMRIFEGMGCGALVLTDLVPEQGTMFNDGQYYVVFRNRNDLMDKLDYYLKHLDKAQVIATAGYKYLLANHTYEHRAESVISMMKSLK